MSLMLQILMYYMKTRWVQKVKIYGLGRRRTNGNVAMDKCNITTVTRFHSDVNETAVFGIVFLCI